MIFRRLAILAVSAAFAMPFAPARATDISVDTVTAALPRLEQLIEDGMARTGVPGLAVAVVVGTEVVYLNGFGVREAGSDAAVDADTVFQIASVSKPFASTAIAALVGTGEVDWDSRIADLDPGFRLQQPWVTSQLTIRDVLSHRSGMPDHAGDLLEDLGYDREQILYRLRYLAPDSSFRSQFAYTNFLLTEGGVAAARAVGMSWEDLVATRVFEPLGMDRSSARHADYLAAENRATLHVIEDGQAIARYDRNPDTQAPAGGVSSTARDLANWVELQLNQGRFDGRQIVDAAALAETHIPQIVSGRSHLADGRATFYGLGWNITYDGDGQIRLSHSGAFGQGAGTEVALLPNEGVGIVTVTNAAPVGLPEAINRSFFEILQEGEISRDWIDVFAGVFASMVAEDAPVDLSQPPAPAAPSLPVANYAGRYSNVYWGDLEIVEADGALTIGLGNGLGPFALDHWARDVFSFDFVGRGDETNQAVAAIFTIAQDQRPSAVEISLLNRHGNGTFTRADGAED